MKISTLFTCCLIMVLMISGCGQNQESNLTVTPMPTNTHTPAPPTATSFPPTSTPIPPTPTPKFPIPVTLTILNNSETPLTILSGGPAGKDFGIVAGIWPIGPWTQYSDKNQVKPNTSFEISTYFGYVWAVSDYTGRGAQAVLPLYYVTESPSQTITITSFAVTNALKVSRYSTCSLQFSFPSAAVNYVNNSSVTLDLHYVSKDCVDQVINTLPAGDSQIIEKVRFGDFFYLSDPDGKIVLVYVATEPTEQTVTVSDAAVNYHLGK